MRKEREMYQIAKTEREYLRELARRQAEYANLPVMEERRRNWISLNTGKHAIPPVVVETCTFSRTMMPDEVLRCSSKKAREMEYRLLKNIREFELINDDKVMPDHYEVPYCIDMDEFGVKVEERHTRDSNGQSIAYVYDPPIRNLKEEFYRLRPVQMQVNREKTNEEAGFAQEVLDGILTVKKSGIPPMIALTWKAVQLLGLENFMITMYEEPEEVHRLMGYLTENQIYVMKFYEENGILTSNSGNQETGASSYGFTDGPSERCTGSIGLQDIWLWAEAEEASSISPGMFKEFCLPYIAKAALMAGRIYYGCCEPLEENWEAIYKAIPNTRKVSVSPWCDQRRMGEMLKGSGVVFSRKPLANFLGVSKNLEEDAWQNHIAETFESVQGGPCEIIMRDIYTVTSLHAVKRAVEIAKKQAKKYCG